MQKEDFFRERKDKKKIKNEEAMRREEQHYHNAHQLFDDSSVKTQVTLDDSSKDLFETSKERKIQKQWTF